MADTAKRPAKKAASKKTSAKKTSARKTATDTASKKSAQKKSATKKPTKKVASGRDRNDAQEQRGSGRPSASKAALSGASQLADLTGKEFEGIVGISKADDSGEGWTVQVEVLEMRRIPATTDVLALYELEVDGSGDLNGYKRVARYVRGKAGEEGG